MSAGDQRAVGQSAADGDGLDDAGAIGRRRTRRRALGPSPPVRQVVADREPAASGPLVAKSLQHRRFPVAAGPVRQHHDAGRCAVGFVGDARDVLEVVTTAA